MESALPISLIPISGHSHYALPKENTLSWWHTIADHFIPHARNNYHPHIFGHRLLSLFSAFLVAMKIFSIAALTFGPIVPAFSSAITVDNIIQLTNEARKGYTLAALTENKVLDSAAQTKANDMLAKGYFSHNTPDGKTPWDFISAAGYNYMAAGENLAVNFTEAENVETAWMNSPGHKANIVNKNFEEIGIGISQGVYQGHEATFVVQMFGNPAVQKVALTDTPTPVQVSTVPTPVPTAPVITPASSGVLSASTKPSPASTVHKTVANSPKQAAATAPTPLTLSNTAVTLDGDAVVLTAQTSTNATQVLAYFGQQAVRLDPKNAGTDWKGSISAKELTSGSVTVRLVAYDIAGNKITESLADFSNTTPNNYSVVGTVQGASTVNVAGLTFDPKALESRFYLLFIAGMLMSLIIAIAVHKHVQHLGLVMNGSFVVILATLLWVAG